MAPMPIDRFRHTPVLRHLPLLLGTLVLLGVVSWWVAAGSSGGWFGVGVQVVNSREGRDVLDRIPLPSPLREGYSSVALPRFHTYLGSPEQAATFFRARLPPQGLVLEREWASGANAVFQIWRGGETRVFLAMQAPYSGLPQPTRIGLNIAPFVAPPALP